MAKKLKIAQTKAVSLNGIDGSLVNVEVHITDGLSQFTIVGLPDTSVSESKSRVLSALRSVNIRMNEVHITVNLAPASIPKRGPAFDLAIACAALAASGKTDRGRTSETVIIGELGLDGRIQGVRGILPICLAAKKAGVKSIIVPRPNVNEAKLVDGIEVHGFGHIYEVINHLGGSAESVNYQPTTVPDSYAPKDSRKLDFADVIGQAGAKYALEIAAAGFHNVLMIGPPGTGKSMLASSITSILPPLTTEQAIEVTSIHSVAGYAPSGNLITIPPFESPHHTATAPAIVGGGSGVPTAGSVSRAHHGVLFLDEAPEFSPRVLQTLRQPLETGEVIIDRSQAKVRYPAHFQLIMACNPCPCGFGNSILSNSLGDFGVTESNAGLAQNVNIKCKCTSLEQRRYLARLSGPLLDRVDIFTEVLGVSKAEIDEHKAESSADIQSRVIAARERALHRLKNTPWRVNSQVPGSYMRRCMKLDEKITDLLSSAVDTGIISLRGADRVLRVSWTIADLQEKTTPDFEDIAKAMELKGRSSDE